MTICSISGCDRALAARTWCIYHYNKWHRHGDPEAVTRSWGDGSGYTSAHLKVYAAHGKARDHECLHCSGSAEEWAYDHEDPAELTSPRGQKYSRDTSHYMPLCKSCHRKFDDISPQGKLAA